MLGQPLSEGEAKLHRSVIGCQSMFILSCDIEGTSAPCKQAHALITHHLTQRPLESGEQSLLPWELVGKLQAEANQCKTNKFRR